MCAGWGGGTRHETRGGPRHATRAARGHTRLRIRYTAYFADRYDEIITMASRRAIVPLPDDPMATGDHAPAHTTQAGCFADTLALSTPYKGH